MRQNNYLIGRINNTHGIKGALKVQSFSDFDRFYVGAKVIVTNDKGVETELEITKSQPISKGYLVYFKNITTIDEATKLKGKYLYANELPVSNELHFSDLYNLEVVSEKGTPVGVISEVIDNGCQTVIKISAPNQKHILLPFVAAHIKGIENHKLVIFDVEGMVISEN